MRFSILVIALLAIVTLNHCQKRTSSNEGSPTKGTLFIIGGGNRDSALMEKLVQASGWKNGDWISIATMASRWDSAFISMNNEFQFYTRSKIRCIRIDSVSVKNPVTLDSMRKSKIIYLNGGDQSIFMVHIQNTDFKKNNQ